MWSFAFILTAAITRTGAASLECWNCYSDSTSICANPYRGRYMPNSTVLIPDCSYNMARNFHSSVMFVLSFASRIINIGGNVVGSWYNLTEFADFDCCKAIFNVTYVDNVTNSYIIRGCCYNPTIYDQCAESEKLCKEVSNSTYNNSSCKMDYCSVCSGSRCNLATAKSFSGSLTFAAALLTIRFSITTRIKRS